MRFIEQKLKAKTSCLRGQKMNEILDPSMRREQKGDDRILDCCMYFHQHYHTKVTLLSNDRNLSIKVMVHEMDSISAESIPKLEALLNRITTFKSTQDYVMEIDEFYPPPEEDYDMMLDEEDIPTSSKHSQWASKLPDPPAYLDNDPTLTAPKKPRQNTTYSNSNFLPLSKDASWTSIYSPK